MANQFKTFCPTDTGTNLTDIGDYDIDTDRISGQKPGIAKSALNNRALRQANAVTSQFAQYLADKTGADILDDGVSARLLAQINAAILPIKPTVTRKTSSSGTHNATFYFFIASGSATAGATYTNNAVTFTVVSTVSSATMVAMTGNGAPSASGTLTKSGGTGDTTLTFYAMRAPLYLIVDAVGAGGGGAGGGTATGSTAGDGGDTTFGTSLITAGKGSGGLYRSTAAGGNPTVNSPAVALVSVAGQEGGIWSDTPSTSVQAMGGPTGGASFYGGGGRGGAYNQTGAPGATNSGSGGGGGGNNNTAGGSTGTGGGAGAFVRAYIPITSTYSWTWAVGAGGTAGGAGTSGGSASGGAGAAGNLLIAEYYQ